MALKNDISNLTTAESGIPQDSVLGPLLFIIYVNDFLLCSSLEKCILYAEDTILICNNNNAASLQSRVNEIENKVNG